MLVVGLTGGIAAGKSLVASRLEELGIPVIDADQSARRVVEPGAPGLAAVVQAFGRQILDKSGALNRAALGERVFADAQARKQLEAILHPLIALDVMSRLAKLQELGHSLAVVDAALMVETGSYKNYPLLLVVHADDALRIERIVERDGLSVEQAQERLQAQAPQAKKMDLADVLINNNGSIEQTMQEVDRVAEQLRSRAKA